MDGFTPLGAVLDPRGKGYTFSAFKYMIGSYIFFFNISISVEFSATIYNISTSPCSFFITEINSFAITFVCYN
jgi:hypothetical protein